MNFITIDDRRINLDKVECYQPSFVEGLNKEKSEVTQVFFTGSEGYSTFNIPVSEFDKLVKEASERTSSLEYAIKKLTEAINVLPSRMPTSVRMHM